MMQEHDGAQACFVENVSAHSAGEKDVNISGKIYGDYNTSTFNLPFHLNRMILPNLIPAILMLCRPNSTKSARNWVK
jgi:hypothetical protein